MILNFLGHVFFRRVDYLGQVCLLGAEINSYEFKKKIIPLKIICARFKISLDFKLKPWEFCFGKWRNASKSFTYWVCCDNWDDKWKNESNLCDHGGSRIDTANVGINMLTSRVTPRTLRHTDPWPQTHRNCI